MFALASAAASVHLRNEKVEAMVKDLKDTNKAEAHAEADEAACVTNKADCGHAEVLLDKRVVRILNEDVQHGQVFLGITENWPTLRLSHLSVQLKLWTIFRSEKSNLIQCYCRLSAKKLTRSCKSILARN